MSTLEGRSVAAKQCEHQVRAEVFLPQDCIDFYLENPTESASKNIKKFLLKYWFENRGKGEEQTTISDICYFSKMGEK